MRDATPYEGAWCYENWRSALAGTPEHSASEIPLYSDAYFTGEISGVLGPYQIFNPVPEFTTALARVALILRASWHISDDNVPVLKLMEMQKTDTSRYHGGALYDEIAALVSLTHGVRLAAGGEIRTFRLKDDPRGRPHAERPEGAINLRVRRTRLTIPRLARQCALTPGLVPTYPLLPWPAAEGILRAARSYQEAVWIADTDPHLAWLLLVSAVETVAAGWSRLAKPNLGDPVSLLAELDGKFAADLESAAGPAAALVLRIVATTLVSTIKSQKKFLAFLAAFLPQPLEPRPTHNALDWDSAGLEQTFKKVYLYRSKALHESVPFPEPMCLPPDFTEQATPSGPTAYSEVPMGLAAYSKGGVWLAADLPLNLHAFEHIVRHAILRYWRWLAEQHSADLSTTAAWPE